MEGRLTVPERVARTFVTKSCFCFGAVSGTIFFLTALTMVLGLFDIDSIDFSDWLVSSSPNTANFDALQSARDIADSGLDDDEAVVERSKSSFLLNVNFLAKWPAGPKTGDEFFDASNVMALCEAEGIVLNHPKYPLFCQTQNANGNDTVCDPHASVVDFFYNSTADRLACTEVTDAWATYRVKELYSILELPDDSPLLLNPALNGQRSCFDSWLAGTTRRGSRRLRALRSLWVRPLRDSTRPSAALTACSGTSIETFTWSSRSCFSTIST